VAEDRTVYERIAIPLASSRPGSWFYVNLAPHLDRPMLRLSRGRLSTAGLGRVGMLTVRGAKSGQERKTPLVHTKDGETILLVASRGGDIKHPGWYRNVIANPDVRYLSDGEERPFRARELSGEERARAWRLVNRTYPGFSVYEKRAGERLIPVIALEPR
jgi:deazaflavin-dependent oxidoreductase (nitroreductase family)